MKHAIACPTCHGHFQIWTYGLGHSELIEYRCTLCPITLALSPYEPVPGGHLPKCPCGGSFSTAALHRCPLCNAELPMDWIKSQINWWGTPDGVPGVTVTRMLSLKGGEFRDPGGVAP